MSNMSCIESKIWIQMPSGFYCERPSGSRKRRVCARPAAGACPVWQLRAVHVNTEWARLGCRDGLHEPGEILLGSVGLEIRLLYLRKAGPSLDARWRFSPQNRSGGSLCCGMIGGGQDRAELGVEWRGYGSINKSYFHFKADHSVSAWVCACVICGRAGRIGSERVMRSLPDLNSF